VDRRSFFRLSTGAAVGTAAVTTTGAAAPADPPAPATEPPASPARGFRAMWLSSVEYIDWPSRSGLTAAAQQEEYLAWLGLAGEIGRSAVLAQVRAAAHALWPAPYEPWSACLTGTQGPDPGYGPLAFQVEAAHARNLEYRAWFNPHRGAMSEDPDLVEDHPARR